MTGLVGILFFTVLCELNEVFASQHHKRLFSHLFRLYDYRAIPVEAATDPVKITIENIKLTRVLHIDEDQGTVDIHLWISLTWHDPELIWCPSSYGGIKKIAFQANDIWCPDIILSTGVDEVYLRGNDVAVLSTGRVFYYSSVKLTLSCLNEANTTNLECSFAFGAWTLVTDIVHLYLREEHMDTTHCLVDPNYKIKGNSLVERNVLMTNFPMPWKMITARIQLEKIANKNSTLPHVLKLKRNK